MNTNRLKKNMFINTIFLYLLIFSNYFFGFISVPYQTRVLGPEFYGRVGFAVAFMTYFRLIIDFGFLLSATESISINRDNKSEISRIVTSVNIVKIILICFSLLILTLMLIFIPRFQEDKLLYILMFIAVTTGSLLPDYLYRGVEQMKVLTWRTIVIQAFFVSMVFLFLKHESQYYLIPIFTFLGNLFSVIFTYVHAYRKLGLRVVKVDKHHVLQTFKRSSTFFYSRIASSVYGATNTFLLGINYPVGNKNIGFYTSSEMLINTAKSFFSPIADSLYPYMVKNKDFKLVKKILVILMPIVIMSVYLISLYSDVLMGWLLGAEFKGAGYILNALLPIIIITPLNYILGFPVLSAMGKTRYANYSVISGSIFHFLSLIIIIISGNFTILTLCYLTVVTESLILIIRISVIFKYRKILNPQKIG